MARGFDSKYVSEQQDDKQRVHDKTVPDREVVSPRRRSLELARADLLRRIEAAPEPRREALRAALADLESQIEKA